MIKELYEGLNAKEIELNVSIPLLILTTNPLEKSNGQTGLLPTKEGKESQL